MGVTPFIRNGVFEQHHVTPTSFYTQKRYTTLGFVFPVNGKGFPVNKLMEIVPWHDRQSADGTISPGWHNVARYRAGEFNW